MNILKQLLGNFFTHKDFLPSPSDWSGTLFTPLQIVFCAAVAVFIVFFAVRCAKKSEKHQKTVFALLWAVMVITEPLIALYDACAGKEFFVDWTSAISLWPCSIFLYAAPFAFWGKGNIKYAACGYICTLGLLGGTVNFVYPATYLSTYSCISMAGLRTIFYHGSMIFVAAAMLLSGYHSFKGVKSIKQLLLPMVPAFVVSIFANFANALIPNADYMFFKMESFFFAPVGKALPTVVTVILVYIIYLIIHCVPYLPSYVSNRKKAKELAGAICESTVA